MNLTLLFRFQKQYLHPQNSAYCPPLAAFVLAAPPRHRRLAALAWPTPAGRTPGEKAEGAKRKKGERKRRSDGISIGFELNFEWGRIRVSSGLGFLSWTGLESDILYLSYIPLGSTPLFIVNPSTVYFFVALLTGISLKRLTRQKMGCYFGNSHPSLVLSFTYNRFTGKHI